MSKTKAIIVIIILLILMIGSALLIFPLNGEDSFKIGKSNYDFFWISTSIKLGLDLEGGMYATYQADLSEFESSEAANRAMDGTIANLQTLLFSKGYTEAIVTRQGDSNIRVEIPAVSDTEQLVSLLGEPATLEFKDPDNKVVISGSKHLEDATAVYYNGYYAVSLSFNAEGTRAFAEATAANINKQIGIYINDQLVISPTVNATITDGNAIITGNYDYNQANDLAIKIKAGTFDVVLSPLQTASISPTLGNEALKYGIMAGLIGILAIILFLIIIYKGLGVAASISLLIYVELLIIALAVVPWVQLTLPGIAGIILSVGMAVDANVLIFERIRDERKLSGRAIQSSVKSGFKKALVVIFDGNITTIFGAIIMIIFGATAIQSFGVTLLIGVLLSMFSAIFVTRLLINISLAFNDTSEVYYGLNFKEVEENE